MMFDNEYEKLLDEVELQFRDFDLSAAEGEGVSKSDYVW